MITLDNKINLNKYEIRTDLAIETIEKTKSKIKVDKEKIDDITITKVNVGKKEEKRLNKKKGIYITIEFDDITNFETREKVGKVLEGETKKLLKFKKITDHDECLIIGLGNDKSTPDALGPKAIEELLVTRHLFLLANPKEGIRKVSALNPGVMGNTGIETSDIIMSVINTIKPDFIIVIDALAALSIERLNKTIQMTDTGIHPGSGVGNQRKEISEDILGIPVIAIGVPTVVDSAIIVSDTITYLFKHLSYIKNNYDKNKLVTTRFKYKDKLKDQELSLEEKKEVIGLIGTLSEIDQQNLIKEVLISIDYNLMVTPKEIDFLIDKLSNVIASSLNNCLHKEVTHY